MTGRQAFYAFCAIGWVWWIVAFVFFNQPVPWLATVGALSIALLDSLQRTRAHEGPR